MKVIISSQITMRRLITLCSLVATFALYLVLSLSTSHAQALQEGIAVEISLIGSQQKSSDESINVKIKFTNTLESPVFLLRWNTPFDLGLDSDMFSVFRGKETVPYIGAVFKRAPPVNEDYIKFEPGEMLSEIVELERLYALVSSGPYNVTYNVDFVVAYVAPPGEPREILPQNLDEVGDRGVTVLASNAIGFVLLEGRQFQYLQRLAPSSLLQPFAAASCSAQQNSEIQSAHMQATGIASNSFDALRVSGGGHSERYAAWFGVYDAARHQRVVTNFNKIRQVLNAGQARLLCDGSQCRTNIYAYVFPNDPYKVYVCTMFWRAAETGTDLRSGTIIHELSHFSVVAGTSDYAYGQQACGNLSNTNPSRAISNADSHEYYAENTRILP